MNKYFCLTMEERINKIGELLAKAVYLYAKKEQEEQNDMAEKNIKDLGETKELL
ncbi:MAG: hypothetical protein KJ893_04070 [Candidatus Omnitrophica bacterium]|nr:hypothetical protein [Candidatus Omnitrophota bacterium]MCG2702922.1 hypothetical protein [Candidatus Omnitrophota bacterium]